MLVKIKNFCSTKDPAERMKRQAADWSKYLKTTYLTKYLKYRKNSQNSTITRPPAKDNPTRNWAKKHE